jgi:hypothetical protein
LRLADSHYADFASARPPLRQLRLRAYYIADITPTDIFSRSQLFASSPFHFLSPRFRRRFSFITFIATPIFATMPFQLSR